MPSNYVLLSTITLGAAGASSISFTNIPQTGYTDLVVRASIRGSSSQIYLLNDVSFNGVTSNLTSRGLEGSGGSAASMYSFTNSSIYTAAANGGTSTANTYSYHEIYISNYARTDMVKSVLADGMQETNGSTAYQSLNAGMWNSTSAINRVDLTPRSNAYLQYSTFSLYGVAALGTDPVVYPKAVGGDIVTNDGTYWYHAFLSSGIFTPSSNLSCDVLVVAGGGGGATSVGGGGGGGGLLGFNAQSLIATNYPVTIGAGGASVGSNAQGITGNDSQFGALTLVKGGGGGGSYSAGATGKNGGSGGGAGGWAPTALGGTATPSGQGNNGGNVTGGSYGAGGSGGGGGAGTAGGSYSSGTVGASGGQGSGAYTSWAAATKTGVLYSGTYYYAAGGPGVYGTGGTQASASFGTVAFGASTVANTGQGGCGDTGGAGGSGIVIVRYSMA